MLEVKYWEAVENRDSTADGSFVFAVRTTGIYCRPSCPSRRPKRENVVFFPRPDEAENAGFRACMRCQPREDAGPLVEMVQKARNYIEENLDGPLTLEELGKQLNVSHYHLQRSFKRIMGMSPRQYAEAQRFIRLKSNLKEGDNVTTALYEAGYSSSSRLYERAPAQLGMTPATYGQGGKGAKISFAVVNCSLGLLLVATTAKGVCFVSLGDDIVLLEAILHKEYPQAEISRNDSGQVQWVGKILAYVEGHKTSPLLPLDVKGTAFQWQVWDKLRAIPYGETRSYSQVAKAIGQPTAVRAVARACATNPVALVIPCHRVLREDGNLGGYRWGIERKEKLIAEEKAASN